MPLLLPVARCALTAPFHPYRSQVTGGIFSAALSVGKSPTIFEQNGTQNGIILISKFN